MAKIYTKKTSVTPKIFPKKETIQFLLNYSKALQITTIEGNKFETILN